MKRGLAVLAGGGLAVPLLAHCGGTEKPYVVPELPVARPTSDLVARPTSDLVARPTSDLVARPTSDLVARRTSDLVARPTSEPVARRPLPVPPLVDAGRAPSEAAPDARIGELEVPAVVADETSAPSALVHCASAPTLLPDGAVPPAPPHAPLGQDIDVDSDRSVYVLPGNAGDPRIIVYLHGMCGDATAADYFREAVRAHGTLLALRGDTPCLNGRFKWRDDASKIQKRIRAAFESVNAAMGGALALEQAVLFGYSQGAERAERVAQLYPKQYPRLVLGGPPTKASPQKLAHSLRVAILGGELETTETMRAGHDALVAAGLVSRFFTLDCAYHGYFGEHAETQLSEVLSWVSTP